MSFRVNGMSLLSLTRLYSGTSHASHIERQCGTPLAVSISDTMGHPFHSQPTASWDVPHFPTSATGWDVLRIPNPSGVVGHPFHCRRQHTIGTSLSPIQQHSGTSLVSRTQYDGMSLRSPTAHKWDIPFHSTVHCVGRPMLNRQITHLRTKANGQVDRLD
jgi:hypothetical protein